MKWTNFLKDTNSKLTEEETDHLNFSILLKKMNLQLKLHTKKITGAGGFISKVSQTFKEQTKYTKNVNSIQTFPKEKRNEYFLAHFISQDITLISKPDKDLQQIIIFGEHKYKSPHKILANQTQYYVYKISMA